MSKVATLFGVLLAGCTTTNLEENVYPFVGNWDCEVGIFRITADTYTPPFGSTQRIANVESSGSDYLLSFADGSRVSLFGVGSIVMTLHSPITGDTFSCRKA